MLHKKINAMNALHTFEHVCRYYIAMTPLISWLNTFTFFELNTGFGAVREKFNIPFGWRVFCVCFSLDLIRMKVPRTSLSVRCTLACETQTEIALYASTSTHTRTWAYYTRSICCMFIVCIVYRYMRESLRPECSSEFEWVAEVACIVCARVCVCV